MKPGIAKRLADVQIATVGKELFGAERTLELVRLRAGEGKEADRRDRARLFNEVNRRLNLAARSAGVTHEIIEDRAAVNKLTNRERKAWVRAGSPPGVENILKFSAAYQSAIVAQPQQEDSNGVQDHVRP